jgi:hypothetical protein
VCCRGEHPVSFALAFEKPLEPLQGSLCYILFLKQIKTIVMTTTSIKMNRQSIAVYFLAAVLAVATFSSCKKDDHTPDNGNQAQSYSADVLDSWMTLQLRLMRNATGIPNQSFSRHYVYAGIAALESLAPGLKGSYQWSDKWNGLNATLPIAHSSEKYYYPANVNAAMAAINRSMFPNASAADKQAIDSLEVAHNGNFASTEKHELLVKSANFGKAVAAAVFNWSEIDGYKNASNAYTAPVGAGLWVPTAPAFAAPSTPYWRNNRTVVPGSTNNTRPPAPFSYSTQPGSPFHNMAKQVYDASKNLTADQMAMATFWRDVPGATTPGHWLSIVQQVIRKTNTKLDKAALAYALTGAAIHDAFISCWDGKYEYNLVRPITYIRGVMEQPTWNAYLSTPPHPEYPSAHSSASAGAAEVLEQLFGNIGSFTDHTYDYMGLAPRTFNSFTAIAVEAGQSRLYAGIHYQPSIDAGIVLGKKVTTNIFAKGNK